MSGPTAKQIRHTWHRPTGDADDPWAWLRDRDDPDTIAYLRAENAHADEWFAAHDELVETLFGEIKSRVQETDTSAPVRHGPWWYVTRTEEGSSYPIHCRGESADHAEATVLLDQNREAEGHEFFHLGAFEVSPDHSLAAWSADTTGDERSTLRVRDLVTGLDLPDEVHDTTAWAGVAWAADGEHLFYVTPDEQERPHQVWRHRLGTPQSDDVVVLTEPDERFFVSVGATRTDRWIVIHTGSKLTSEAWLVPADQPTAPPVVVAPRREGVEYDVDDWGDRLVVLTNLDAPDFRVMAASPDEPGAWTPLVEHEPGRRITAIEPFTGHLVIHEWFQAQPQLRVLHRDGTVASLHLDDAPHDVELGANPEWDTTTVRVVHQSLVTPPTVLDVDLDAGTHVIVKRTPTPNVDLDRYVSVRDWATAPDGTRVPVDVLRCVDAPVDGTAPCLLYGYGSYEYSIAPWFSVARLSLADRGVVWALAHPRGGGELGRRWYEDGKLLAKRNTFSDTLAVADHLVATGAASPGRMAIRGGSAGGLLVGACLTLSIAEGRPDRFASAVAEVPFVDIVTTMSDPTLPLTVTEWEEWGDPRSEPFASYMLSYSPYDTTVPADYPAIFVTAGLNDPRVSYHEPAKWVAKLRAVRTNDRPLLLRTELGAGHAGPSGRYDAWRDEARVLAFVLVTTA
ncbi:MAG: S9 family peptidase [Ilumatobacteraceae bacterium]|jgi:oligopeptidase B|nr:S9 family peptidase [Ilumatobacteraceae bacterium]